jgi:hypothetical protein
MEKTQSQTTDRGTGKLPGSETPASWDRPGSRANEPHSAAVQGAACATQGVAEGIKKTANEMGEAASNVAQEMKSKVQGAAQAAAHKAEETKQVAGEQMQAFAGKIREGGEVVSEKAEQFGQYLQEHDFSAIGRDVTEIVRKYPVQSLLIGIGLGILLGRSAR